jgi:hypothetical protein
VKYGYIDRQFSAPGTSSIADGSVKLRAAAAGSMGLPPGGV